MQGVRYKNDSKVLYKKGRECCRSELELLGLLPSVGGVTCNEHQQNYIIAMEAGPTKVTVRRCLPVLGPLEVKFADCKVQ